MTIYGVESWEQIGDTLILTGAVRNVRLAHPEIRFMYMGFRYYKPLLDGNPDFTFGMPEKRLPVICYGDGEHEARRGTHVNAQTMTLCEHLHIDYVPVEVKTPVVYLTEQEKEWSRRFEGKWLVNANCQTCSVSKGYPYWQDVVDGMIDLGLEIVQVGGKEKRDISVNLNGVEDMRGKTTLRQWLAMAYGCAGIVSPPSGIIHAGAVWSKPMVCLTGAREDPAITGYGNTEYITSDCEYYGCEAQQPRDCKYYDGRWCKCMKMPSERVIEAIQRIK